MNNANDTVSIPSADRKTVVVIGNGMVGQRFCEKLVEFDIAASAIASSRSAKSRGRRTTAWG